MPTSILTATVDLITEHVEVFGPNPEWVKVWLEIRQNERLQPLGPLESQLFESITKNFIVLAQKVMAYETESKE